MNAYIFVKLLNLFRFIKIKIATLRVDSKIICSVIVLVSGYGVTMCIRSGIFIFHATRSHSLMGISQLSR